MAPNIRSKVTQYTDKVFQKLTRFRGIHHALGWHDNYHDTYRRLTKSEAYHKAAIIHLNNIHGGWFDIQALQSIDRDKPIVWTLHDMWCMTGGEAYVFEDTGYQLGNPITPFIENYPLSAPLFDRRAYYLERKKSIYQTLNNTVFVGVSDWITKCLKTSYVHHPDMKIETIKNGVDLNLFNTSGRGKSFKEKNVLFFNNPSPFKGAHLGLAALQDVQKHCQIHVVGAHPQNLENFEYHGQSIDDRESLASLFRQMDLLLFPSLAENMPLTVLEAMACGTVVVALPVGGIPEIVLDRETGYLASSTSKDSLSDKLKEALSDDLVKLSKSAANFVQAHHNFNDMKEKYNTLYKEMLAMNH